MHYLGYDIGSSSVKAALVEAETGKQIAVESYPKTEMPINSPRARWAEQPPEMWWENVIQVTQKLGENHDLSKIGGIGISYQMHGLVLIDAQGEVLRPSIIWCDSRAIESGDTLERKIGSKKSFEHLLNVPGNFTAAKLKWVADNEPEVLARVHKIMLPGDYINFRLTGEINTTPTALSEGTLWDFQEESIAHFLLQEMGLGEDIIPEIKDIFSIQGLVEKEVAELLGIPNGTPVCYRAGDQPNNAMALGVNEPGEVAATGGTSGVVYAIKDNLVYDEHTRVNSFAHVNHTKANPRVGVLLCINGAGSMYRWVNQNVAPEAASYNEMEKIAQEIPIGSDDIHILPFGNGAERMLYNTNEGAQILHFNFNRHHQAHIYRAAIEGIAFSFVYGIKMMQEMGLRFDKMKVGNDNLFQSDIFSQTIASLIGCEIDVVKTTGAVGAARAVGYTLGHKKHLSDAMAGNEVVKTILPQEPFSEYQKAYQNWEENLKKYINE